MSRHTLYKSNDIFCTVSTVCIATIFMRNDSRFTHLLLCSPKIKIFNGFDSIKTKKFCFFFCNKTVLALISLDTKK